MNDSRAQLVTTFQNQHLFSIDYSPLYAALFGTVAGWLEQGRQDPLGAWLFDAADGRRPLNVSLLLAAGLHRDILLGVPELSNLARYYPTAGGSLPAGRAAEGGWHANKEFQQALRRSIMARQDQLRAFIQSSQVQTNETGRGISWLLPVSLAGWPRLHLLDLGASAGLNLAADQRSYQFVETRNESMHYRLGEGEPVQFEVRSTAGFYPPSGAAGKTPQILGRLGCDINPFMLRTPVDEATLAAFIWGDQVARLERLREGIAAYRQVSKSQAPVQLHAVELPGELPLFLDQHVLDDRAPLICYNTYIRMYLPDRGRALRGYLAGWAKKQTRPVVWIQWEPPSRLNDLHGNAPDYGWLAWTIDMWHRGEAYHWHIAWVHPHGQRVQWLPELNDWIKRAISLPL